MTSIQSNNRLRLINLGAGGLFTLAMLGTGLNGEGMYTKFGAMAWGLIVVAAIYSANKAPEDRKQTVLSMSVFPWILALYNVTAIFTNGDFGPFLSMAGLAITVVVIGFLVHLTIEHLGKN